MRKAPHGLLSAPAAASATPGATEKQRRASVLMRQHLMFFNEADVDGDSALDFDEFVAALPENVRTAHPQRKLRQFFRLADEDGSRRLGPTLGGQATSAGSDQGAVARPGTCDTQEAAHGVAALGFLHSRFMFMCTVSTVLTAISRRHVAGSS